MTANDRPFGLLQNHNCAANWWSSKLSLWLPDTQLSFQSDTIPIWANFINMGVESVLAFWAGQKIHLYCGLAFDLKRALWRRWQGMDLPKPTLCPDINPPCSHHRVQRCVVMFRKSSQILLHPFCHNCRCGLKQQSRRLRQRGDSGETSRRAAPGLCRSKHSPALELFSRLGGVDQNLTLCGWILCGFT